MIFIDENLCTGCGLCVDACEQGAIALQGNRAVVDAAACTECRRCLPVCLTGAIGSAEIVQELPAVAAGGRSAQFPAVAASVSWADSASPIPPLPYAGPVSQSPTPARGPSKLQIAEKLLSGLFSVVTFALDRRSALGSGQGGLSPRRGGAQPGGTGTRQGGLGPRRSGNAAIVKPGRASAACGGRGQGRRRRQERRDYCRGAGRQT